MYVVTPTDIERKNIYNNSENIFFTIFKESSSTFMYFEW